MCDHERDTIHKVVDVEKDVRPSNEAVQEKTFEMNYLDFISC